MCSIPYFNALTPDEITTLVAASQRESMRPGESMSLSCTDTERNAQFCITISGHLALARDAVDNAHAVQQAELLPSMKLGIGDYFVIHSGSEMKVIAMELVEYLVIPMQVIEKLSTTLSRQIQVETSDVACDTSEVRSFSSCRDDACSQPYPLARLARLKATSNGLFSSRSRIGNASSHLQSLADSRNAP